MHEMLVSIRRMKGAFAGAVLLGSASILLMYDTQHKSRDHDDKYFRLLQEQTAEFAKIQVEGKRVKLIEQNKQLFNELELQKNTDEQRREVLARLELIAKHGGLLDVSYQFLSTQYQTEINNNLNIVSDSLRLQGIAANMVVFNQAISQLGDGAPNFFELKSCDIKRKKQSDSGLDFECILSWYLLA